MADYATIADVTSLWRSMTEAETARATALIPVICDSLRYEASKAGFDLDDAVGDDATLANVAKSVTVDIVARTLQTSTSMEPMSQMSQAAGGYSISGTFLNPGGGLFIKKSELARLGIYRQRMKAVSMFGYD